MGMFNGISGNFTRYPNGTHQQDYDNATSLALEQNSRSLLGTASFPIAQLKGQFGVLHDTIHTAEHANNQSTHLASNGRFTPNFTALLLSNKEMDAYQSVHQLITAGADPSKVLPPTQAILSDQHAHILDLLSEGSRALTVIARDGNNTIASSGYQTSTFTYEFKIPESGEDIAVVITSPKLFVPPVATVLPAQPKEPEPKDPEPQAPKPKSEDPKPEPEEPEIPTNDKIITPVVTNISLDTGLSDSDGITSDNTLYFFGTAGASCIVEVFIDGVSVGFTLSNSSGQWVFDHTKTVLPDAQYIITAQSTNVAGTKSPISEDFPILIDTAGPELEPELWDIIGANGNSAADGLIDDNLLIFEGTAEPQTMIELFLDDISIGTATTDVNGNWSFDNTHNSLSNGSYTLTLKSFDLAGNSIAMPYEVPFEVSASGNSLTNIANNDALNDSFLIEERDLLPSPDQPSNSQPAILESVAKPAVTTPDQSEVLSLQDILPSQNMIDLVSTETTIELPSTASNDEQHNNELLVSNYSSLMENMLDSYEQIVVHS